MAQIQSKDFTTLVIDEKGHLILNALMTAVTDNPLTSVIFIAKCNQYNISKEDIASLLNHISEQVHRAGWCKDPDCQHKKDNHEAL